MLEAQLSYAVVGAGLAGAALAERLHRTGARVCVIDKARGAGGRLATRVLRDTADAALQQLAFDHGAPGFNAQTSAFRQACEQAAAKGLLRAWLPRAAHGGLPPSPTTDTTWLPVPGMPAWCRALLDDAGAPIERHYGHAVDALQRHADGWILQGPPGLQGRVFDRVLLALPPAQTAPLLAPHQPDVAARLSQRFMAPTWTLMAASDGPAGAEWDVARPVDPVLGSVWRQTERPGRTSARGLTHWVAHARADWSERHLEDPAAQVLQTLQESLSAFVGHALSWRHAQVHRWRYAVPGTAGETDSAVCWWSDSTGLGACGDAWPGASVDGAPPLGGVERAWLSSQALADQCLARRGGGH